MKISPLYRNVGAARADTASKKKKRHVYSTYVKDPDRVIVPDEVVAEVRGDFEFRGMKPQDIARKHCLKDSTVVNLLKYETRLKVEPK